MNFSRPLLAHTIPFVLFLCGLGLTSLLAGMGDGFWLKESKYWVYPLQTVVCGVALAWYWREYDFGKWKGWYWGVMAGLLALGIWLSPQLVFGQPWRTDGFNPDVFAGNQAAYWATVGMRFLRLVVVVALVEEIFWRGFLMRYLIKEDFSSVAFGTYRALSFFGVALLFMLEHSTPDYPAAFVTGLLFNGVAVITRSLGACVIAHAVTNLGLGAYVMTTKQWGFW